MGGETTRFEIRGETTRGETTRGETSWGRNVLLPFVPMVFMKVFRRSFRNKQTLENRAKSVVKVIENPVKKA